MLEQSTKDKFAEILAAAQLKANNQVNGIKTDSVKSKQAVKKNVTKVSKPVQPTQKPAPVPVQSQPVYVIPTTFSVASLSGSKPLANNYPELSTTTVDELIGKDKENALDIRIVSYSEKSIAVIGDTKKIKDALKALGGSFNARLTCGAGWIFPKSREAKIRAEFSL
jgi:hypothetical protein